MNTNHRTLTVGLLLVMALGACNAAGVASPSPSAPPTATPVPTPGPTEVPGGNSGNAGSGVVGGGGPVDPNLGGGPLVVVAKGGTINPTPVSVETLSAVVDGRRVTVEAGWWSGVEPCYTLDSVAVKRDGHEITIALTEGAAQADVACIEIAVEKVTSIDLGELPPGEYTISAQDSVAPPLTVTVA